MFTGTAEQLAAAERDSETVARQIADLLNGLNDRQPGAVQIGTVILLGCHLHRADGHWTVRSDH